MVSALATQGRPWAPKTERKDVLDIDVLIEVLADPRKTLREVLRRTGRGPFLRRLAWDGMDYPMYAYGLLHAAEQARALGMPAISALEFGVAGGNGLVTLERHGAQVTRLTGVQVRAFGFDTGGGLPAPTGLRDLPYVWRPGDFVMDEAALRARLHTAEVVLGDVEQTVDAFSARSDVPPIGFVSFDLDFHSSTVAALRVFATGPERRLPRTFCYFDDTIGGEAELHSPFAGELLAIDEFNEAHADLKLAPVHGLRHKRRLPALWNDQFYVLHDFGHPQYAALVRPVDVGQTALRG